MDPVPRFDLPINVSLKQQDNGRAELKLTKFITLFIRLGGIESFGM